MWSIWLALASVAIADPGFQQLYSDRASASSYLKSNWNKYSENYHPNYVLDNNPRTAWVEGVDGQGEGEVLSWDVSALSSARAVRLRIRNGYQKSEGLFAANSVPREVQVTVWRGAEVVVEQQVTLKKAMGWQEVVLPTGGRGLDHIELKVLSVYPGSKYKDTCISDIETRVDSDVPYNASFEQAKQARLTAWVTERVQTAAYFANLPQSYPYASTRFAEVESVPDASMVEARVAPLRVAHDAMGGDGPWFSAAFSGKPPARPDGLWSFESLAPYLKADAVSLFETTRKQGAKTDEEDEEGASSIRRTNYEVERKDGALHRVRFAVKTVSYGRGTSTWNRSFLLEYSPDGLLTGVYVRFDARDYEDYSERGERHIALRWENGQVAEIVLLEAGTRGMGPSPRAYTKQQVFTPDP